MFKNNTKSYILLTALMTGLLVISFLLPATLGALVRILVSALYAVTVVKYHYKFVIASGFLLLAVIALFGGLSGLLTEAPLTILLGLSVGLGINGKLSLYQLVLVCAVTYLAADVAILWYLVRQSGMGGLGEWMMQAFSQASEIMTEVYAETMSLEQLAQMKSMLGILTNAMITIVPAIYICMSLLIAYIAVGVAKRFLTKSGMNMSHLMPFHEMRGDKTVTLVFGVLFLLGLFDLPPLVSSAISNVVTVLFFLYYVFGLAFIDWYLMQRGIRRTPRMLLLIAAIFSMFLFAMMPVLLVTGLGIVDAFADLRRRTRRNYMI